jgi:UDP-N-acetylglucosamine 3-dehydrogenase
MPFFNQAPGRICYSNVQINLQFANGVVGHLTGSYDTNPRHNLERCEVLGTKGRFVLDNLYEELTFYPRGSDELTVIRNSIMGGLSGFNATFSQSHPPLAGAGRCSRAARTVRSLRREGLAVQEIIEAAIRSFQTGRAEEVPIG